jgi:hypothetical protein
MVPAAAAAAAALPLVTPELLIQAGPEVSTVAVAVAPPLVRQHLDQMVALALRASLSSPTRRLPY